MPTFRSDKSSGLRRIDRKIRDGSPKRGVRGAGERLYACATRWRERSCVSIDLGTGVAQLKRRAILFMSHKRQILPMPSFLGRKEPRVLHISTIDDDRIIPPSFSILPGIKSRMMQWCDSLLCGLPRHQIPFTLLFHFLFHGFYTHLLSSSREFPFASD